MNDLSYLNTEYARGKMIEEYNKPYLAKEDNKCEAWQSCPDKYNGCLADLDSHLCTKRGLKGYDFE